MKKHRTILALCLSLFVAFVLRAEDRFFDSDGIRIHYTIEGEGEPLILIHGFSASAERNWAPVRKALIQDHQVIALDNRGHGQSDKPHDAAAYGLKMVEDIVRLMDHLGIKKAHVAGYSMGGFITTKLLTTHPDRLISATLGGAGWMRAGDNRDVLEATAKSLAEGKGIAPLMEFLTPRGRPAPTPEAIEATNKMVLALNDPLALAAVARGMLELAVPEAALKENRVPTLALIGEIDPLKEGVDRLAGAMANLRVQVIEGADHMTAFLRPEFATELKGFLGAHSAHKAAAGAR